MILTFEFLNVFEAFVSFISCKGKYIIYNDYSILTVNLKDECLSWTSQWKISKTSCIHVWVAYAAGICD